VACNPPSASETRCTFCAADSLWHCANGFFTFTDPACPADATSNNGPCSPVGSTCFACPDDGPGSTWVCLTGSPPNWSQLSVYSCAP
jgi:hypothetical protein